MTDRSPSLLGLAVELISEILSHAKDISSDPPSRAKICILRLVCRQLKLITDADFFSVINLDFTRITSIDDHIRHLADGNTSASTHCKTLRIETRGNLYVTESLVGLLKDKSFTPSLARAIKSLQNVKAVRWEVQSVDLVQPIMEGLTALRQLEDLHLCFNLSSAGGYPEMFPLRQFSRLRRVTIGNVRGGEFLTDLTKQLGEVIVKSPLLEHLEYVWPNNKWPFRPIGQENNIFHTLVQDVSRGRNLPLRRLAFRGCSVGFDERTLPHLRNLSTLSICELASDYANIWKVLSEASIFLKGIAVDVMDQDLIRYLTSYSGLEELSMTCSLRSPLAVTSNLHSAQFYASVLPRHNHSLTCLIVVSALTNWCINPNEMNLVLKCQRLKELSITLDFDKICHGDYERIILTALELPCLRSIKVLTSLSHRTFGYGTGAHRYRVQTLISLESILTSLDIGKYVESSESCALVANQVEYVAQIATDGRMRFLKKRLLGDAIRWR
ncbi:hypothetical protein B0H34DRAFT_382232 [Crassisporium funariophilum]|nr:hypothetical protein B0H34DRAFT_382232 [Crassisporium funariophilum]